MIALAFVAFGFTGYSLLRLIYPGRTLLAAAGSVIVGMIMWVWSLYVFLILNFPTPFYFAAALFALLSVYIVAYSHRANRFAVVDFLVPCISWLVCSVVMSLATIGTTNGDAGYMILVGVEICRFDEIPSEIRTTLLFGFPPFLSLAHATICEVAGREQFVNFIPVLAIALTLFLSAILREMAYSWGISLLICFTFLSSLAMVIHVLYFNHHLLVGLMIVMFAFIAHGRQKDQDSASLIVLLILVMGLDLSRAEAALLALILIIVFVRADNFSFRERVFVAVGHALAISIHLGFILTHEPNRAFELQILGRTSISVMIVVSWSYVAYLMLVNRSALVARLDRATLPLVLLFSVASALLSILVAPRQLLESVAAILMNMFLFTGFWGLTWWVLAAALIWGPRHSQVSEGTASLDSDQAREILADPRFILIVAFLSLMLVLATGRQPYHHAFGDTFNRFLMHILPIWIWLVADQWREVDFAKPLSSPKPRQVPTNDK